MDTSIGQLPDYLPAHHGYSSGCGCQRCTTIQQQLHATAKAACQVAKAVRSHSASMLQLRATLDALQDVLPDMDAEL